MKPFAVYPRWRGEHITFAYNIGKSGGLSPLARGTLLALLLLHLTTRFIPAGAGNTDIFSIVFNPVSVYPRWRGEHTDKG